MLLQPEFQRRREHGFATFDLQILRAGHLEFSAFWRGSR
jgi:hypothetical protein